MTSSSRDPELTRNEIEALIADLQRQREGFERQKDRIGTSREATAAIVEKITELRARSEALRLRYEKLR